MKVKDSAEPGTYVLPLELTYTYLREAEEYGSDLLRYNYQKKTVTLPLEVRVTPDLPGRGPRYAPSLMSARRATST